MKKIIKIVTIIGIFLLVVLIVQNLRKIIIINNICAIDTSNYINYHLTVYNYNDISSHFYDVLRKENVSISTLKNLVNDYESYSYRGEKNDESIQIVTVNDERKAFVGNSSNVMAPTAHIPNTKNFLEIDNLFNILTQVYSINSEECNGKDCYLISINKDNRNLKIWVDKETYLIVRNITITSTKENGEKTNIVMDWRYEFDCVKDSSLQKPNLEGINIEYK